MGRGVQQVRRRRGAVFRIGDGCGGGPAVVVGLIIMTMTTRGPLLQRPVCNKGLLFQLIGGQPRGDSGGLVSPPPERNRGAGWAAAAAERR